MKKLFLSVFFSVLYVTSASADLGVNIGIAGNAGLFTASATEKFTPRSTTNRNQNGSESGEVGYMTIFAEKTLGDHFMIGLDYNPEALETETAETAKMVRSGTASSSSHVTNTIQIDFEELTTMYVGARLGDFYIKAGVASVDVMTKENLGTGGAYGNTSLDGSVYGMGYDKKLPNGFFLRAEGQVMSFDGVTLTNANDSEKTIQLKKLDGVTGKIAFGKSF